jgi:hypothetical protein
VSQGCASITSAFPAGSFISLHTPVEGHLNLEVALIGSEGMLGVPLALGVKVAPLQALVQGSRTCLAHERGALQPRARAQPATTRRVERYVYVLMDQLALAAAWLRAPCAAPL